MSTYQIELIQKAKLRKARFWTNPARVVADPPQIKPSCVVVPVDRDDLIRTMTPRRVEPIRVAADAALMHVKVDKPRWRVILEEVAAAHSLEVKDITGRSRTRPVVLARHEAAYRLHHELKLSYPRTGWLIGNRDHTSALHGARMHARRMAEAAE